MAMKQISEGCTRLCFNSRAPQGGADSTRLQHRHKEVVFGEKKVCVTFFYRVSLKKALSWFFLIADQMQKRYQAQGGKLNCW